MVSSLGLQIINRYPTRFAKGSNPSLLDLAVVSDPSSVLVFDQLSLDYISDHDLLFCTYDINFSHSAIPMSFTFKDFCSIDHDALQLATVSAPWDLCRRGIDANQKLDHFQGLVSHLYNQFVPTKTVRVHNNRCPWFTSDVIDKIKTRNKLYSKWKHRPSDANWCAYKVARNTATFYIRSAKTNYYASKLSTSLPPKKLWSNLRQIGVSEKKNNVKCDFDPDDLNKHFLSTTAEVDGFDFAAYPESSIPRLSDFEVVTEDDVIGCVAAIKSNSAGEDGVPIRFIKLILPLIVSHLTHLINFCIMSSTFPQSWKIAKVIPIAKKPNATAVSDFRPISILPCLSKVLEKIIAKQILRHLSLNLLLSPFQSGFRPNHSCSTAMVNVLEDIRQVYDKGYVTLLCLLDFSKAFDKVNHKILCWKLQHFFGFSERAVKLLRSFLSNRSQRVVVGENSSALRPVQQGVPQGSILGPILFCIFINDLPSVCKHSSIHLYADDVQLYLARPRSSTAELASLLNEDLSKVHTWSLVNGLLLNPAKCQIIPISNKTLNLDLVPDVWLSHTKLQLAESVTSLGFRINRNLSGSNHINSVIGRVYGCLRKLWLSASFTPTETRRKLIRTLVLPIITYAEVVYCNLDSLSQHKLQVAYNDAVRYVYGIRRHDHISEHSRDFLGCTLKQYINARNCIFLHRIINSKSPSYLFDKLQFARSARTLTLIQPRCKYLNSSRLFFVHVTRLWNSLPFHLRGISNAANFKKAILLHFSMQS